MPELTPELTDQGVRQLTEFSANMRSIAQIPESTSPLADALRRIAYRAEVLSGKLAMDPPADTNADDLAIVALLAGYESGREGIKAAFDQIRDFQTEGEDAGDHHGD